MLQHKKNIFKKQKKDATLVTVSKLYLILLYMALSRIRTRPNILFFINFLLLPVFFCQGDTGDCTRSYPLHGSI
jgi:hypothetical protein